MKWITYRKLILKLKSGDYMNEFLVLLATPSDYVPLLCAFDHKGDLFCLDDGYEDDLTIDQVESYMPIPLYRKSS